MSFRELESLEEQGQVTDLDRGHRGSIAERVEPMQWGVRRDGNRAELGATCGQIVGPDSRSLEALITMPCRDPSCVVQRGTRNAQCVCEFESGFLAEVESRQPTQLLRRLGVADDSYFCAK